MNEFLKGILDGINSLVGSYGWSIMLFTLLIRVCLTPFDYKSRVGMRKMTKLQPEVAKLQKKYAKDQEKLNQKTSELYRKEKVNPLSSCLPMLLSMPILFAMFAAMRMIANEAMVQQTFDIILGVEPTMEPWLWIKNVWMPDSPFSPTWPDLTMLQQIPGDIWQKMLTALQSTDAAAYDALIAKVSEASAYALSAEGIAADTMNGVQAIVTTMQTMPEYVANVAKLPGWSFNLIVTTLDVNKNFNGFFLLPLLAAGSQFLMTKLQGASDAPANANQQQNSTNSFMKWFFPLFSLWICAGYNAAFAVYWVTSNLLSMVQNFAINWYLDRKEKQAAVANDGLQK